MAFSTPFEIIAAIVCQRRCVRLVDVQSAKRTDRLVNFRAEIYWLARHLTDLSIAQMGKAMGGRDHTTVLAGLKRQEDRIANEPFYIRDFDQLRKAVENALLTASGMPQLKLHGDDGLELARKLLIPGNFTVGLRPSDVRCLARAVIEREEQLESHREFAGFIQKNLQQLT